jgi:hypothetical protein
MSNTTNEIQRVKDSLGIHWSQPCPPNEWGWTDESIDAMAADTAPEWWSEAPGWMLDRLDARDEAEVD